MNTTKIMFRYVSYPDGDPEVLAIFPEIPADDKGFYATCYARIGQHSSCDVQGMIRISRPATEAEYSSLLQELKSIGYDDLRIIRRTPAHAYRIRKAELAAWA